MGKKGNLLLIISLCINVLLVSIVMMTISKKGGLSYRTINVKSLLGKEQVHSQKFLPYYYDRKSLFERNRLNANSIVFLGDSLTDGNEWSEVFKSLDIVNRGINRDTTQGILNRLESITNGQPKQVFIMIGTNDIGFGVNLQEIKGNYTKIIQTIKTDSPNTEIIIQSCIPLNSNLNTTPRNTKDVVKLNNFLMQIAEEEKVQYVDLFEPLSKDGELNSDFTHDGIHLNAKGYVVWESIIEQYIK